MRRWVWLAGLAFILSAMMAGSYFTARANPQPQAPPAAAPPASAAGHDLSWAFPVPATTQPPAPPASNKPITVPGSTKTYTPAQLEDQFAPPDWFPNEHPNMPEVVANGHKGTDVRACDLCHLPNGLGHPESANISGMPAAYIERQIDAWKNGTRKQGGIMQVIAKQLSEEDSRASAEYFASVKPMDWVKVVEADMVPQSYVDDINMRMRKPGGGMEALGDRIIELPVDETRSQDRDPHSGTIAYVPKGSIAKGQALVQTGAGRTIACATCHGDALTGLAEVPRIAGLSPLYLTRALYGYKDGTTPGTWAELMRKPVEGLSYDDIVDIAAYLASMPANGGTLTGRVVVAAEKGNAGTGTGGSSASAPAAAVAQSGNGGGDANKGGSGLGGGSNADLVAQGNALYLGKYQCLECHGMNGEGTDDGPDLIGTRLDADGIRAFLINPDADARTKGMPNFDKDSPEIAPLVAYVLSIKKAQ